MYAGSPMEFRRAASASACSSVRGESLALLPSERLMRSNQSMRMILFFLGQGVNFLVLYNLVGNPSVGSARSAQGSESWGRSQNSDSGMVPLSATGTTSGYGHPGGWWGVRPRVSDQSRNLHLRKRASLSCRIPDSPADRGWVLPPCPSIAQPKQDERYVHLALPA